MLKRIAVAEAEGDQETVGYLLGGCTHRGATWGRRRRRWSGNRYRGKHRVRSRSWLASRPNGGIWRGRSRHDAVAAGLPDDDRPLRDGGTGATTYAEAVAVYLGLAVDKVADRNSTVCAWASLREHARNTF